VADLSNPLNHLLEALDNVSAVAESVAEQFGAANINPIPKLDRLSSVLETTSMNHREAMPNRVAVVAPDNKDNSDRLPEREPAVEAELHSLPSMPEVHAPTLTGDGAKKKDEEKGEGKTPKDFFDELARLFQPLISTAFQVNERFSTPTAPFGLVAGSPRILDRVAGEVGQAGSLPTRFAFDHSAKDQATDATYSAMQKLQPPFPDLASSVGNMQREFPDVFKTLESPINGVATTVGGLTASLEPLVNRIKALFGELDFSHRARHSPEMTGQATNALSAFSAPLATTLDATAFSDSLPNPFHTVFGPRPHAPVAPDNLPTSRFEQIANEVTDVSSGAIGARGQEKENSPAELFEKLMQLTERGDAEIAAALVNMGKAIDAITTAVTAVGDTATAIYNALPNAPDTATPAVSSVDRLETGYDRARHGDGLGSGRE
jgi:hypothetical protein